MRYLAFTKDGSTHVGVLAQDEVVDLSAALPDAPGTIREIIAAGPELQKRIADAVAAAPSDSKLPLSDCKIAIPIPDPGKIVCLGLNYADHAKEGGHDVPDYPSLFMRTGTSMIAAGEPMVVPRVSERLDYEVELMVVIGKRCRHVPEDKALDVIFGYTVFNDGSVRDYQRKTAQWTAGKNFDGTGPIGPWIVTADELPPGAVGLRIHSRLGDRILQDSNTENMLFSVKKTIAILSEIMTLEPGDLIATGTPEGVGHARKPPLWLKPGDEITVEVEGVGALSNPVVAEAQ
jgi:2-keto-4-pentenoate hydratase/2-oxohepta-3-ene-1,7-dioic acid hydratase in catechol pathway